MNTKYQNKNLLKNLFISFVLIVLGAICSISFLGLTNQTANIYAETVQNAETGGYLSADWFNKTGLNKQDIKEIYIQKEIPSAYAGNVSVAAKDELGTAYDETTADVVAYWDNLSEGQVIYIVCPQIIYAPQDCYELFANYTNVTTIVFNNFDTSKMQSMGSMFLSCESLVSLDLSMFDVSNIDSLDMVFSDCYSLQSVDLSNWDTSNIYEMYCTFYNCISLKSLDLSSFTTSQIGGVNDATPFDFYGMFFYCLSLESLNLSSWDISNAKDFSGMFCECESLKDLQLDLDITNAVDATLMFAACISLENITITANRVENLIFMDQMFGACISLTSLDLSMFYTNNVQSMMGLFENCQKLQTLNIQNFNTSNVNDMSSMFFGCKSLTSLDLSNFNTSSIVSFCEVFDSELQQIVYKGMFQNCTNLQELKLSQEFVVGNAMVLTNMFSGCESLKALDLSNFDMASVSDVTNMLYGMTSLSKIVSPYNVNSPIDLPRGFYNSATGDTVYTQITSANCSALLNPVTLNSRFSITYDVNGGIIEPGSITEYQQLDQDQTFIINTPSKQGFAFAGWTVINNVNPNTQIKVLNGVLTIPANEVGDITLTANYAEPNYQILLDSNGGSEVQNLTYDFSTQAQSITLPEPTKTGFVFTGWTFTQNTTPISNLNGLTLSIPANAFGAIGLVANYKEIITFNIVFDASGGNELENVVYTQSEEDQQINLPTAVKQGYEFSHWEITVNITPEAQINNNILTIPANATGNFVLTAVYKDQYYTITFDTDGGEPIESMTYLRYEDTYEFYLVIPARQNCIFYSWSITVNCSPAAKIEDNTLLLPADAHGDIVITADWILMCVVTYDINAVDQFGLDLPQKPELVENQGIVYYGFYYEGLPEPKLDGYIFEGWYLDKKCTKMVDETVFVELQKDHNLYAKWSRELIDVTSIQILIIAAVALVALAIIIVPFVLIYKK